MTQNSKGESSNRKSVTSTYKGDLSGFKQQQQKNLDGGGSPENLKLDFGGGGGISTITENGNGGLNNNNNKMVKFQANNSEQDQAIGAVVLGFLDRFL